MMLVLLPAVGMGLFVLLFGRNMPFWDDWELVPIFRHLHAGHLYWHDFWQQHNEHRIVLPTLALVGLAYLTQWNTQVACLVSVAVAAGAFWLLYKTVLITAHGAQQHMGMGWLVLMAIMWFSPGQVENWLWSWQLEWFMSLFGVMLVVYGLARLERDAHDAKWLPLVLGGGVLAQYSLGNGTLMWPLIMAALVYLRASVRQIIVAAAGGVLSTVVYYLHYTLSANDISRHLVLEHPFSFIHYVLIYLGRPLSFLPKPASMVGTALLLGFLALALYMLFWRRELFRRSLPWIILGLYALGTALVTGVARLGFGVNEALSSRYTTISSLFVMSVLMLVWMCRSSMRRWLGKGYRITFLGGAVGLYVLVLVQATWGLHAAAGQHTKLTAVHDCTHAVAPDSSCLLTTYPNPPVVAPRLQYLKTLHWGGY
jgi:hypothetical protein